MTGWRQDGPLAKTADHNIDYIAIDREPCGYVNPNWPPA